MPHLNSAPHLRSLSPPFKLTTFPGCAHFQRLSLSELIVHDSSVTYESTLNAADSTIGQRNSFIIAILICMCGTVTARADLMAEGWLIRRTLTNGFVETQDGGVFQALIHASNVVITVVPAHDPHISYYRYICDSTGSKSIAKHSDTPLTNVVVHGYVNGEWVATTNPGPIAPLNSAQITATQSLIPDATIDSVIPLWLAFGSQRFLASKQSTNLRKLFDAETDTIQTSDLPKAVWKVSDSPPFAVEFYHSRYPGDSATNEVYEALDWMVDQGHKVPKTFFFSHHFDASPARGKQNDRQCVTLCTTTNWSVQSIKQDFASQLPSPARVIDKRFRDEHEAIPNLDYPLTDGHLPTLESVRTSKQYRGALSIAESYDKPKSRIAWGLLSFVLLLPLSWIG